MDGFWRFNGSKEAVVLIIGKVRHSYAANKTPLHPWVLVRCNGTVLVDHCTCMAGLAETCSHVGAVLHWVETAVRVTTCTSQENKWLMPTPMQSIPYLQLSEIDFSAPKCQKVTSSSAPSATVQNVTSPSESEKEDFFREIAKEQGKKPLILSVTKPYCEKLVHSSDHPKLLHGIYKPEYLESNYAQLLTLAETFLQEKVTPTMVDHLDHITRDQSKSKNTGFSIEQEESLLHG